MSFFYFSVVQDTEGSIFHRLNSGRVIVNLLCSLMVIFALGFIACDDNGDDGDDDVAEINLQEGAVYSMSNDRDSNEIVVYSRALDGTLSLVDSFETGGAGSGSFEDTANGLVLGSSEGESSPNNFIETSELLFATNAGDNTISVFTVEEESIELVEIQDSMGEKPVSITINNGIVYVLNSGEVVDDLVDDNGDVIPNCTTGGLPSVTGFTVTSEGILTPIPNSTRQLSGDSFSGCAQVSFNPDGDVLVVTERTALAVPGPAGPGSDEGAIVTFVVNDDGTLGEQTIISATSAIDVTGQGPFGFTFRDDVLLTTEQFDGPAGPGLGAAASYTLNSDGSLDPISGSVDNGGTDTCWFVVTDDGQFAYATSFFGTGRVSIYEVAPDGGLTLFEADVSPAVLAGASDISLSRDSQYFYQKNSIEGTINAFRVEGDGSLTLIQTVQAHDPSPVMAARIGIAAF